MRSYKNIGLKTLLNQQLRKKAGGTYRDTIATNKLSECYILIPFWEAL
jgi:hypothetical protein